MVIMDSTNEGKPPVGLDATNVGLCISDQSQQQGVEKYLKDLARKTYGKTK